MSVDKRSGEMGAVRASTPLLLSAAGPLPAAGNSQAWMTTFADLVALLLTFFVLLFAMSKFEQNVWQNLTDSLAAGLNSVRERQLSVPTAELDISQSRPAPGSNLDYLKAVLRDQIAGHTGLSHAYLQRSSDRLTLSLPADLLFAPGSIEPSTEAAQVLETLCSLLRNLQNQIEVAGHADPSKPRIGWRSNWALSTARALAAAALLQRQCYQGDILAVGYGDAHYQELPAELPDAQRRALARRVDIIVHEAARPPG